MASFNPVDRGSFIRNENSSNTKKGQFITNESRDRPNEYSRTYEASPQFPFTNGAVIAVTSSLLWDLHRDNPTSEKYGVMTNLFIVNNSSSTILIYPNQQSTRALAIPAGVQIEYDSRALGGGFTSVTFYNSSGSSQVDANAIRAVAYKEGVSVDSTIKNAHRLFVKFLGLGRTGGR
jgi:hypothetical protein